MRESPIEKHFCKRIKAEGGRAYKWVSPGNKGVPDRIAFVWRTLFLVELKATDGVLSTMQKVQHKELERLGYHVVVLSSKQQIDEWIDAQKQVFLRAWMNTPIPEFESCGRP